MTPAGRNAPCPCGSGKKYKHCCLKKPKRTHASTTANAMPANKTRTVFFNSVGDVGDALSLLAVIEHYKDIHPDHQTLLYDSVGFGYYYKQPDYIDEIHPASEHLYAGPFIDRVRSADPEFVEQDLGKSLGELRANRICPTHSIYNRNYGPEQFLYPMDFDTFLTDIIESGFDSLNLELKDNHHSHLDEILAETIDLKDNRPAVGVSTELDGPLESVLSCGQDVFIPWLESLGKALVDQINAQVLWYGPWLPQRQPEMFLRGDYIDIDKLTPLPYYQLEILKRVDFFIGTWSGVWEAVNLLRSASQVPALEVLTAPAVLEGKIRPPHRNYYSLSGRWDTPRVIAAFRHPDLNPWLDQAPQSPQSVIETLDKLKSNLAEESEGK